MSQKEILSIQIDLRKILIENSNLKCQSQVPNKHLVSNANGYGGTIVDLGTAYTIMKKVVFDLVAHELNKKLLGKRCSRSKKMEALTGLGLCYNAPPNASILIYQL
ncbi:eukaryotic aspartyl protease family protein [Striga asiatica]|uniref:Eukaryotic aspartyl protease family protein n=1 Tax=Striga asiatica TaxID=4170 RepID=A0A5A7QLS0_STRAF|nr:eukaryotic aspartyl protease family protein [Striga asiatica]